MKVSQRSVLERIPWKVQLESIISLERSEWKLESSLNFPTRQGATYFITVWSICPLPTLGAHRLSDPRSFIRYSPKIPSADCSPSNFPCRGILSRIASSHNPTFRRSVASVDSILTGLGYKLSSRIVPLSVLVQSRSQGTLPARRVLGLHGFFKQNSSFRSTFFSRACSCTVFVCIFKIKFFFQTDQKSQRCSPFSYPRSTTFVRRIIIVICRSNSIYETDHRRGNRPESMEAIQLFP